MTAKTKENVKKVLIGIAILAALVVLYKVGKSIFGKKEPSEADKRLFAGLDKEIKSSSETQSYSNTQYMTMADRLQNAMEGAGTGDSTVRDVFSKMKNRVDTKKLILAFGSRQRKIVGPISGGDDGNLVVWLQDEGALSEANAELKKNNLPEID